MSATLWRQIHGGSTHFPIVLLLASVVFDFMGSRSRDEALQRGLQVAGLGSAVVGMLGGIVAAIAGLFMTHGRMLGGGLERTHHYFVWPAMGSCVALVTWRLLRKEWIRQLGSRIYLVGMSLSALLMVAAGYSGGEMLMAEESPNDPTPSTPIKLASAPELSTEVAVGQRLFLKNCAHCHGAEGKGDEGPDLHNLDWADEQIGLRIRNGKKGQMTAFAGKFSPEDIRDVIAYLRTLK